MDNQEYLPRSDERIDIGTLVEQSFEEDSLLSHTQALRLQLIKTARVKMEEVPAYAALALSAADGIDKQILNKRKLGVLSALAEQDEAARSIIRNISGQIQNNPFKKAPGGNINENLSDDGKLPPPPEVDGIRDIGVANLTYETFMQEKGIMLEDEEEEAT